MAPRWGPRNRNLRVVVDEHISEDQALVFRHDDSPNELVAEVAFNPFVFFRNAVPVCVQRGCANTNVDSCIEHCFRTLNGPSNWRKIAVEARGVINRVNLSTQIKRVVVANPKRLALISADSDYVGMAYLRISLIVTARFG
ncbi:MAG TPA: hypothetical protein VFN25_07360 [Dokdonella sp.]|nr:hypothetical protein [Dokdonella sp.]HET9032706.1 hypothetical protein [Dokdonella sp.]